MKEQNWSYLAGLMDGEGCITLGRSWYSWKPNSNRKFHNPYWQYSPEITITNTSLYLMKWLIEHFGGVYYCQRNATSKHKARYYWRPKGKGNRKKLLLAILPYLVLKKEQAKLLLKYDELIGHCPQDETSEREKIFLQMKPLNRKGTVETNTLDDSENELKIESELAREGKSAPVVTLEA